MLSEWEISHNYNNNGDPVVQWSLCIIENTSWEIYVVFENHDARWKQKWHIWLPWGRSDKIDWKLEHPKQTILRELLEETGIQVNKNLLIKKWVIHLHDSLWEKPSCKVSIYWLQIDFECSENSEVSWRCFTRMQLIEKLQQENWYKEFRPIVIEALALYYNIKLLKNQKHIYVQDANYTIKDTSLIHSLISVLNHEAN